MGGISTHILDTARGRPATDVPVTLSAADGAGGWAERARARTDADGRARLIETGTLTAGDYRISFEVGGYLAVGDAAVFYPVVQVHFTVARGDEHYHVPLLLSPYGYSTYRGS